MFTGIVQSLVPVVTLENSRFALHFPKELLEGLQEGASVSVDGVCLTCARVEGSTVFFDVIEETLKKTTLSTLFLGRRVNVERSLRYGQEVGGHLVSGHIMGTGVILSSGNNPVKNPALKGWVSSKRMKVKIALSLSPYMLHKGFVAIDGVSLTLDEVGDDHISFHLIPETLKRTTLGFKKKGDLVNVEVDADVQRVLSLLKKLS